ncbi:MAG: hypothetical protein JW888_15380 [Pirellulales bacterium]|nr:hypothetical protein [Pirellulales bacterium]
MKARVSFRSFSREILAASFGLVFAAFVLSVGTSEAVGYEYDDINWEDDVDYVKFSDMQGVDGDGESTWQIPTLTGYIGEPQAYKLRGVVLNDPSKMLDSTANYAYNVPGALGGQWQIYIQAVGQDLDPEQPDELAGDFGGAALWVGQNYGNLLMYWGGEFKPQFSYSDEHWNAEMTRLNTARGTIVEPLRAGDLIEVRARGGLGHNGKFNCNEQHLNDPSYDFDIVVIDRNLPLTPTAIALSDVMDEYGTFLFDASRTLEDGPAEYYQSQYVTLDNVTVSATGTDWSSYGQVIVTDGTREFAVKLGDNAAFDSAALPSGTFNVTGIFDQESGDPTAGYRMWAVSPADFAPATVSVPGDANGDGVVDEGDAARLAAHWGTSEDASWFDGDFDGDRLVGPADAAIMAAHWGVQVSEEATSSVPEPTVFILLLTMLAGVSLAQTRRTARR